MSPTNPLQALVDITCDLTLELAPAERYQRLLSALTSVFPCDAAALLQLQGEVLVPLAAHGLSRDVMGRRFPLENHPRLAAIVASRSPIIFPPDDPRPDPYDGLLEGEVLTSVHSCMGCSLYIRDRLVGALTLDAHLPGRFNAVNTQALQLFSNLTASALATAQMMVALQDEAKRQGALSEHLLTDAIEREGGLLLGQSAALQQVRSEIDLVAGSELTVLITGETGTGKELVARRIHARSKRSDRPLIHVNCAALPESIAESEIFGHVKGAFTGATSTRHGKFELADRGTLFLDEIGELPLHLQPKLLRVLQFGELQRVGSDTSRTVDVRVIAATNRNLDEEIEAGRFRADLYHRLNVYPIHIPPLREHPEDVLLLAGHFLDHTRTKLNLGPVRLTSDAASLLEHHPWSGNVRELEHVLVRAALRASQGELSQLPGGLVLIEHHHLDLASTSSHVETPQRRPSLGLDVPLESQAELPGFQDAVEAFQRRLISNAVQRCDGNWSAAARLLNLDRSNLHRLAKRLQMK